jgi:CelD/BcsL family acetyltransferase involved in cellulose biosynthesis
VRWSFHPHAEFSTFASEWARLAGRAPCHPFRDTHFISAALHNFASDRVRVAVLSGTGGVLAILLLQRHGPGVWRTFAPSQLPFCLAVCAPEVSLSEVLQSITRQLPGVSWAIELLHYDKDYLPALSLEYPVEIVDYAQTMSIDCHGSFDDYWSNRPRKLRSNIRRYLRRLEKQAIALEFTTLVDRDAIEQGVDTYGAIESAGWKGRQGSALAPDNAQGRFYRELLGHFAQTGNARVFEARFDDVVVASRLCVVKDGVLVMLKTTYDEDYSEYVPGRLMLYRALQHAFEYEAPARIEFYTKATPDQLQWATDARMINHVNFYRTATVKRAVAWLKRLKRRTIASPSD